MFGVVCSAAAAFAATNIDDLFVLMLLFGQAENPGSRVRTTSGQYLGIAVLTSVSVAAALGLGQISTQYLNLLGLVPIALGLRAWMLRGEDETDDVHRIGVLAAALLTIANGGDNLGVYIPLFVGKTLLQLAVIAGVFAGMTGLWCLLGARLASLPRVRQAIRRWKDRLVPAVLILLGISILL